MSRHTDQTQKIDKAVGEKIYELRIAMGLSRQQLADKIYVTHQQMQKYEKGKNRISLGRMALIAKYLKQPIGYFFDGQEFELPDEHSRLCIEVSRNFLKIKSSKLRITAANLIRDMAEE